MPTRGSSEAPTPRRTRRPAPRHAPRRLRRAEGRLRGRRAGRRLGAASGASAAGRERRVDLAGDRGTAAGPVSNRRGEPLVLRRYRTVRRAGADDDPRRSGGDRRRNPRRTGERSRRTRPFRRSFLWRHDRAGAGARMAGPRGPDDPARTRALPPAPRGGRGRLRHGDRGTQRGLHRHGARGRPQPRGDGELSRLFQRQAGLLAEPGPGNAGEDADPVGAPGGRSGGRGAAGNEPRGPRGDRRAGHRDPRRRDRPAAREAVGTGRRRDSRRRARRPAGRRPHDDADPRPGDRGDLRISAGAAP